MKKCGSYKINLACFACVVLVAALAFVTCSNPSNDQPTNSSYTVSFNANGGSGTVPRAQTVNAGSSITIPDGDGLTETGFTFGGWNTNASGTGINYPASASFTPTGDITLYARWNVIPAIDSIYSVSINITGPALGEVPDTVASGTGNFTIGTVTWSPDHNPFQGSISYTATVMLTATANHTFTGLSSAFINGNAASISYNTGNTVTLSYPFASTGEHEVTGISILSPPSKPLTYTHGDLLDLTGLVVMISYNDTTADTVPLGNFTDMNISVNPAHNQQLVRSEYNGQPVVVSLGRFTTNLGILTINPKPITITPSPGQSKEYGAADPTFTYTNTALVGSDSITGSLGRATGINVGAYAFTLGTLSAGNNYTLSLGGTGSFSITAKPITISGFNITRPYNGTNIVTSFGTLTFNGLATGENATVNISGVTATYSQSTVGPGLAITFSGNFTMTAVGMTVPSNYTVTQPTNITGAITIVTPNAPNTPGLGEVTYNSVTLTPPTGGDPLHSYLTMEYACIRSDSEPPIKPSSGWQDTPVFSNLISGNNYFFFARYKADTAKNNMSATSTGLSATTKTRVFTVANLTQWNDARAEIAAGGSVGRYVIDITASFTVPGSTDPTFGTVSYISVTIQGNYTLTLQDGSQGNLLYIYNNQAVIMQDLKLVGSNSNNSPLVLGRDSGGGYDTNSCNFSMKGSASIYGNICNGYSNFAAGGVSISNGTLIMQDNASVHNNGFNGLPVARAPFSGVVSGGVSISIGTFIMQDNASVYNNTNNNGSAVSIVGSSTFTMQGNSSVRNNNISLCVDYTSDYYTPLDLLDLNTWIPSCAVFVRGGATFDMQDFATVSDNICEGGYLGYNATYRGATDYSGNSGVCCINNSAFTMHNNASVKNNACTGVMIGIKYGTTLNGDNSTFTMRDNASVYGNSSDTFGGGVLVNYGNNTFTMWDNTSIYNNTAQYGGGIFNCSSFHLVGGTVYGSNADARFSNKALQGAALFTMSSPTATYGGPDGTANSFNYSSPIDNTITQDGIQP